MTIRERLKAALRALEEYDTHMMAVGKAIGTDVPLLAEGRGTEMMRRVLVLAETMEIADHQAPDVR